MSLTFTPDTDENLAQVEVQNKLSEVLSTLPATVQQYGVTVSKARSNFLMIVMLSSDVQSTEEMNDYAQRNVVPELQRIEGVGQVRLFGAQRAMRIWVDPKKLQNYICRLPMSAARCRRRISKFPQVPSVRFPLCADRRLRLP
ncbi:antibiotic resistance efflux pump component [Neisseria gonorrhoeae]|nr:antibiotic resistance efflux pump component [Neisseria gonorrhoeae]